MTTIHKKDKLTFFYHTDAAMHFVDDDVILFANAVWFRGGSARYDEVYYDEDRQTLRFFIGGLFNLEINLYGSYLKKPSFIELMREFNRGQIKLAKCR